MKQGRPLRFLALVLGGWTALRLVVLWPATAPIGLIAPVLAAEAHPAMRPTQALAAPPADARPAADHAPVTIRRASTQPPVAAPEPVADAPDLVPVGPLPVMAQVAARDETDHLAIAPLPPVSPGAHRLAGSTWLAVRQGGGDSLAFGQLGASQAGVRLTYALDRHVALSGRLSAPLRGVGREAAVGLDWQPTRWPVHLLAEQIIGGAAMALPLRLSLDGYAQAGAVARRGGFVDGAARLARTAAELGVARVEVGGGAWAGAQRGAARADIGPTLALAFPASGGSARLSLDYRLRVAGRASPGSGPALALGSSF